MKPIVTGLVAAAAVAGAASGTQAQSFNCHKAYFADEKLICMSPELSRLDERLDRIFGQNRQLLSPAGRNALDREEERWVVARRHCGPDHSCIEDFYRDRIAELAARLGEARSGGGAWGNNRYEPPVAGSRGERQPRHDAAAPPWARYSSQGEEVTTHRTPPPQNPTSEKRQSAPVQAGGAAPQGASAAVTAPESSPRQRAAAQPVNTAPPPKAVTGSTLPAPHIEFADPASPMTPDR